MFIYFPFIYKWNLFIIIIISPSLPISFLPSSLFLHVSPSLFLQKMMVEEKFEDGDFLAAIERFTEAITLNRNNYQLFGQRSAAYARISRYTEALEDAKRCHELKPDWAKVNFLIITTSLNNY